MAIVLPVIHVHSSKQALHESGVAALAGALGVFVISMRGDNAPLLELGNGIKRAHPSLRVGVNLLGESAHAALRLSAGAGLDLTWSDEPVVTSSGPSAEALAIRAALARAPAHKFFAAAAFKYQKHEPNPAAAAAAARALGFIPTTSGPATGVAPEIAKLEAMSSGGVQALAVASGVTPENVGEIAPLVDYILVATGVSSTDGSFDPAKLATVIRVAQGEGQSWPTHALPGQSGASNRP